MIKGVREKKDKEKLQKKKRWSVNKKDNQYFFFILLIFMVYLFVSYFLGIRDVKINRVMVLMWEIELW